MDVKRASPPPVQSAQPAKKVSQVQQTQQREAAKPKAPEVQKANEVKSRPMVNTQGQTTGRTLNVTA